MPFGPLKVPKGSIWVLGDHRQDSRDSRYNQSDGRNGMVPVSQVVGRAIVVAWPINRWDALSIPSTFDQSGINNQASAAAVSAPDAVALAGAVPLVFLRRRKFTAAG
jgi:signal peptidase I